MTAEKNILVTGGLGFIGSHTVVSLLEAGYYPIILDSLENSEPFILQRIQLITGTRPEFYKGDCRDESLLESIFAKHKPAGVIHFAAYKSVSESVENPIRYFENNMGSLACLLRAMQQHKTRSFIFSSSCTVYGRTTAYPVTEETPLETALSPYGYTKQAGEFLITSMVANMPACRHVILRYFNPVGAHPSAHIGELPKGIPANLVPFITQTAAGWREQLIVHGCNYNTPDGTCIRDYIHVCDLADAHVKALQKADTFSINPEIFNLGTGKGNSVMEVITGFEEVSGIKLNYKTGPPRDGDIPVMYADTKKSEKQLGFTCRYSLNEALAHAWKWQQTLSKPV